MFLMVLNCVPMKLENHLLCEGESGGGSRAFVPGVLQRRPAGRDGRGRGGCRPCGARHDRRARGTLAHSLACR